jgi:hypothetical protein
MPGPPRNPELKRFPTPRWVKVFGIIAIVVIVLILVMLIAGGEHGPSRHQPGGGNPEGHTPPVRHSP